MTISPPAKVKPEEGFSPEVLASGIDSLVLAINVEWSRDSLFLYLAKMKALAKEKAQQQTVILKARKNIGEMPIYIQPHGTNGYEWLLSNNICTLLIGKSLTPGSRPSLMAEIRSETLWRVGVKETIAALLSILENYGAEKILIKPSRVDLCLDLLMDEKQWDKSLIDFRVTRAQHSGLFFHKKDMTGISIGRGKISARLYDKPLEIKQKSKKTWMYDIWKICDVPDGKKIIRTEFQLRREGLKSLGVETIEDVFKFKDNIWAYCTQKWLKFRTNPGKHHTQRKNLPFWDVVQSGFAGEQGPEPLIRAKALKTNKKQLYSQAYGLLTSLVAIHAEEQDLDINYQASLADALDAVFSAQEITDEKHADFSKSTREKRGKYSRAFQKQEEKFAQRRALNFPSKKDYTITKTGGKND